MKSSGQLISKYFSEDQKSQFAIALAANLIQNPQDLLVLAELIPHLDSSVLSTVYPKALEFILSCIEKDDEDSFLFAMELLKLSRNLFTDAWTSILLMLGEGTDCPENFVPKFRKFCSLPTRKFSEDFGLQVSGKNGTNTKILGLFSFLSQLYTCEAFATLLDLTSADKVMCLYLGHEDSAIATACSQLLRWRINSIGEQSRHSLESADYYWNLIFDLNSSSLTKKHTSNSFVFWLRMLNSSKGDLRASDYFQKKVINQERYWQILQLNLVGNSHETRKLCLSILQLSLKQINSSFSTGIMSWCQNNEINLLREWSRYTTLFEVLGVDTSLHQTQAAVNDILGIISEDSLIHPSWGFCLLSTGFSASMDSVRKYSAEILFSIRPENLHLLKHGLSFLEFHFLPYLMLSRHFAVRSKGSSSTDIHCEYGDKFSLFISSVIRSLDTPEELGALLFTILKVLSRARDLFDAVRIYICYGLVQGLQGKKVLMFGKHDHLLLKLFEISAEGGLFGKTVHTLNLRLILNFEFKDLPHFGSILSKFISFNGFEIFTENVVLFSRYLSECGVCFPVVMQYLETEIPEDQIVIFLRIAAACKDRDENHWNKYISTCSKFVIGELLESGSTGLPPVLRESAKNIFTTLLEGNQPELLYETLSSVLTDLKLEIIKRPWTLWNQIHDDVLSSDYGTLCFAFSKLKFFNRSIEIMGLDKSELSLTSILVLREKMFLNSSGCSKKVTSFYKLKADFYGQFFRLLSLYVTRIGLKEGEFSKILAVLNFETSHSTTVFAIATILHESFTHEYVNEDDKLKAILGLFDSVIEMNSDRFKLTEKELHTLLIRVFFHEKVLKSAGINLNLNNCIMAFAEIIITNSYGRRTLMPALAKALSDFQISHVEDFQKLPLLPTLIVKAMIHRELQVSAFKIEVVIGALYDKHIAISPDSQLYASVYGVDEIAYKVWLLAVLNSVNSSECAEAILDVVFDEKDPYNFFNVLKPTDGSEEYIRVQLAKIVISVVDKVESETSYRKYFDTFVRFVENDPSPLVRVYFEWVIAQHLLKNPEISELIFEKLVKSLDTHELKPILVTIYERILFLMIQSMDRDVEAKYMMKLITIIVPAAATNKAVTRHFSMSLAISIREEIRKKSLDIDDNLFAVIENMYKSALATDAFGQHRSGDACMWNIKDDLNLVHISGGLLSRLYDRGVNFVVNEDFQKYLSQSQVDMLTHPIGDDKRDIWARKLKDSGKILMSLLESSGTTASSLQTKSGAWSTVMDVDAKIQMADVKRSDLIVVASLVDKPPNLGGICRLCDVLGAGLLTLHDLAIKDHQQFKSVAVTADHWMPMTEVKPNDIVEFLREKKASGYKLIGLEQTDQSVVLDHELKFPAKSLILLGREKEGIPGELLAELDLCVEIKQVGIVRSMNIQTATAVIVHAYSSQNC